MKRMRRILHLNAGNETGGGMFHIVSLLNEFSREEFVLGVMEKGELQRRATDLKIKTIHFQRKFPFPAPLRQIRNYLESENIDIVHTHGPRANVFANILRKWIDFRWVVTVHSNPLHDFIGRGPWPYGKFLESMHVHALRHADRMVIVSEEFRENLSRLGVDKRKMITAQNGIDFKKKTPAIEQMCLTKNELGMPDDSFIFLMVARLVPVKNHALALKAFANIKKTHDKCHLLLAGDGQEKSSLQKYVQELQIEENVHFLGERKDVDHLYKMADVTLLTSMSEGFPLVLLESARARTPAITTNVGGAVQMIPDKTCGWVIQNDETSSIENAMKEAVKFGEQGRLQTLGESFYKHTSLQFSVEKFANKIYNVYNMV